MPDRVEEQKKWDSAAQRPKILGFRGSKGDLGALGSVKERGRAIFFARLRRGPLLSKSVVFMYCNPKIEVSIFGIFISVGGGWGGGWSGYKKNGTF